MPTTDVDGDVAALHPVPGVRRQPDDQVQVAGRGALAALPALAGQPDPLPVDHPGRDVHLVAAPVEGDPPTAAPVRLLHRQDQLGLLVGAGHRPPAPSHAGHGGPD